MRQSEALARIDSARRALAQATSVPDVKLIRDQVSAIEHYLKRQKYTGAAIADASELKLRAERRLGELLDVTVKPGKRADIVTTGDNKKLPAGISRNQSSRWQMVAAVPGPKFEDHVAAVRRKLAPLTTSGVVKIATRKKRVQKILDISAVNPNLNTFDGERFPILYADPPWRYEHVKTESRAIENQYPTLALPDICALTVEDRPVSDLVTPDSLLFLWATSPKLAEALSVMEAWGFVYRTNLVWVKDHIGMGYYARQRHELLLIGTCGNPPVPAEADRPDSVVTVPRSAHSAKPNVFYDLIDRMYPEWPKLELFRRGRPYPGWKAWGNQAVAS